MLHALPSLRTCDVEPNWEILLHGPVRPQLKQDSLAYLRLRLQLDPGQVLCLIKTYTLLSHKGMGLIRRNCHHLQYRLGLSCSELQQLLLRMPSLTGSATTSLDKRIEFFRKGGTPFPKCLHRLIESWFVSLTLFCNPSLPVLSWFVARKAEKVYSSPTGVASVRPTQSTSQAGVLS